MSKKSKKMDDVGKKRSKLCVYEWEGWRERRREWERNGRERVGGRGGEKQTARLTDKERERERERERENEKETDRQTETEKQRENEKE